MKIKLQKITTHWHQTFYQTWLRRNKTRTCFISVLYFFLSFFLGFFLVDVSHAQTSKFCRSYFVHTDLFESFSADEQKALLAIAEKYSKVAQQPHDSVSDVKARLNQELKTLMSTKKFDKTQSIDFKSLFFSLVREFQEFRVEDNKIQALRDLHAQDLLSSQILMNKKLTKYRPLLDLYQVETLKDLLVEILKHYQANNVEQALFRLHGEPMYRDPNTNLPNFLEMEFLMDLQSNKDPLDAEGNNLLVHAAQFESREIIEFLIKAGVDKNNSKNKDKSPLRRAVLGNNEKTVRALLEAGVNVDQTDFDAKTALMYAASSAHIASVRILQQLIFAGANINLKDKYGETALMQAVRESNIDKARILLGAGAEIDAKNNLGNTALMHLYKSEEADMVKFLLKAGAKIDAQNNQGETILLHAIHRHDKSIVDLLLKFGANPNLANYAGVTPLATAVMRAANNIITKLIVSGKVDVNLKNAAGETALMFAARFAHPESVEELLKLGADPALKNNQGETALTLAKKSIFDTNSHSISKHEVWKQDKKETIRLLKIHTPGAATYLDKIRGAIREKWGY